MGKRERAGAREQEEFLRALRKIVPAEVEQSRESIEDTRAMLLDEFEAAEETAGASPIPARRRIAVQRAAIAMGALALIALVVVLAVRPWRPGPVKTPPESGVRVPRREFTLGPAGYRLDVKTVTGAITCSRVAGYDVLETVTVNVDARDTDSGERAEARCLVEMGPGAAEGSAPYELEFHDYPYNLAGEVVVEIKRDGREASVRFKGSAGSGKGAARYEYDEPIALINLE